MAEVNRTTANEINLETASPNEARLLFRQGKHFAQSTSGCCKGYVQANLTMVPVKFAKDFEDFCAANDGPLPLLFASKQGQYDAPTLTGQYSSDIRTDLPAYNVIEHGNVSKFIPSLMEFGDITKELCFFYLGCSFSFDKVLLSAGIPLRSINIGKLGNVSMYKTNIKCNRVGTFGCPLVVSLRAIPANLIHQAFEATYLLSTVHGAPIHIGNPAIIGIKDINQYDYGAPTKFESGDVSVFWCCGVTGVEAVKSLGIPLAFTHRPGSMFISDLPVSERDEKAVIQMNNQPTIIWLSRDPPLASALSKAAEETLKKLETICSDDPGKRHISEFIVPEDLMKSALCMSHANTVAIVTGFPLFDGVGVAFETDGPPAALALALFLQKLSKQVTLILDVKSGFSELMASVLEHLKAKGLVEKPISVEVFQGFSDQASALQFLTTNGDIHCPRYDHIVAIERPGKASDGHYHTLKAKRISHLISDTDILFEVAKQIPTTFTTGIGDGGNELGMGKVSDKVKQTIPNGEQISSCVSADFVIACGVSNWGGYALCFALYVLYADPIHDRYRRRGLGFPQTKEENDQLKSCLPHPKQEETILQVLVEHGFKDMTNQLSMMVDGLDFYDVHLPKVNNMIDAVKIN